MMDCPKIMRFKLRIMFSPVNFAPEDVIQNEPQVMQQENNNEFLIDDVIMQQHDQQQQGQNLEPQNNDAIVPPQHKQVQNLDIQLRISQRARRSAIPDYYETVFDIDYL